MHLSVLPFLALCMVMVSIILPPSWGKDNGGGDYDRKRDDRNGVETENTTTDRELSLSGGATTYTYQGPLVSDDVFSQHAQNMSTFQRLGEFALGESFFFRVWVFSTPLSTPQSQPSDGLGPLFNAPSCVGCHIKVGRGHGLQREGDNRARNDEIMPTVVQLSHLAHGRQGGPFPLFVRSGDPVYGRQLQNRSSHPSSLPVEGRAVVRNTYVTRRLQGSDGVLLTKPRLIIEDLGYGHLSPHTRMSVRLPPALIGLGLIEALRDADILAWQDPMDADGDGISGRASWVPVAGYYGPPGGHDLRLGRFGWKADHHSLREQNLTAFFQDMGMNSHLQRPLHGDCTPHQQPCLEQAQQDHQRHREFFKQRALKKPKLPLSQTPWDVSQEVETMVLFYTQSLAPPQRRLSPHPITRERQQQGEELFHRIGCHSCHRPAFRTGPHHQRSFLRHQIIAPYSDFLLHDMGPELDDGFASPHALSSEWRTPPLWGIGLMSQVHPDIGFLHDGRAHTLEEAILWHGGEGAASRQRYQRLTLAQRLALLEFLSSL